MRTEKKKKTLRLTISILIICLMMAFVLAGCGDNSNYAPEDINAPHQSGDHDSHFDDEEDDYSDEGSGSGDAGVPPDGGVPPALNTSSAEAFIDSVREIYNVILEDDYGLLHDEIGESRMKELELTLVMYSPAFIRILVSIYNDMGSNFIISIVESEDDAFGSASWAEGEDLIITLNYYNDELDGGVNHDTLSHELAHAMHFIIEEKIGYDHAEEDMMAFNQGFPYVEDYVGEWDEELHSPIFAYDYGMYNYLEDWATVIEELTMLTQRGLTTSTEELSERLSDPRNEPLLRKAQYIREMIYKYISEECSVIFFVLYDVEDFMRAAA